MEHVKEASYLGDIVSSDGRNIKNIKARVSRGLNSINQIFIILENTALGPHYFEVALLLREALLISTMIYNSEIWYGLTKKDVEELEAVDIMFHARLLKVPMTTPKEAFHLELGTLPIRAMIKIRRLTYLKNLVDREKHQMFYRFFINQWKK